MLMLSWDGAASLFVQVNDHDRFKTDDPIGDCVIDLASLIGENSGTAFPVNATLLHVPHGSIQMEITFTSLC